MTTIRPSLPGDEPALKELWSIVYGDEDALIDCFFRELYRPGSAFTAEEDGKIVSAAYIVDFSGARYIYAVATHPEHRRRGYGKAVVLAAVGKEPAYLVPASEALRNWYAREMGAVTINRRPVYAVETELSPITAGEYARRREALLQGVPHAVYTPEILRYFSSFGEFYAGERGIYAVCDGVIEEALPCTEGEEPFIMGFNGAPPLYWGLTLD